MKTHVLNLNDPDANVFEDFAPRSSVVRPLSSPVSPLPSSVVRPPSSPLISVCMICKRQVTEANQPTGPELPPAASQPQSVLDMDE